MDTLTFTQHTRIDRPSEQLDVLEWLFTMTDTEYQAAARGHRGMGTWSRDGRRGMVNVETMGGNLLVQHYTQESGTPSHVVMVSPRSRLYLMHLVPLALGVKWTVSVTPDGPRAARFECTVQLIVPRWLRILGVFAGLRRSVQAHTDEETLGYARDLTKRSLAIARQPQ